MQTFRNRDSLDPRFSLVKTLTEIPTREKILTLLILCFQSLDVLTTVIGINIEHLSEGNPLVHSLVLSLVFKMTLVVIVLFVCHRIISKRNLYGVLGIIAVISVYAPLSNSILLWLNK
jgi:hypothetical protein